MAPHGSRQVPVPCRRPVTLWCGSCRITRFPPSCRQAPLSFPPGAPSFPPAILSFPPVGSGNPSSEEGGRGRGNAEKARGGRETGPVLLPLPLRERPGVRGGNGQLARVAPSMSGNDVVSGEDRRLPTYAGTDSFLSA